MQNHEAGNLRGRQFWVGGEIAVDLFNALANQRVYLGLCGQIGVTGVAQIAPLGPIAEGGDVDVYHRGNLLLPRAEDDGFFDIGEKLEFVFDVFRCEQTAVRQATHVFGAVDDDEVAIGIKKSGVPGEEKSLAIDYLAGGLRFAVVLLHDAGRAHQHFTGFTQPHLHARHRRAHRA